jgi:gliding motility-associated-like protein
MKDTTFILIEKLNGTTCADTVSKKITVNVNPARFSDTVISICQDTSATSTESISLGRSSSDISAYSIQWFNTDSTLFSNDETIQVEKTKATAFKYQIETTNRNTGCISPRSNVTINVNPQITIGLDNPDTICQPFTYDLITNLAKSISGGTQPTYVRTELNGTVISNETAISESGMYTVFYTDENKCDASKAISIQFHQQPGVPQLIGDTILCQGIGDVKLTAKKTGGNSVNQSFVWKTAGAETTADTLTLSTTQYGKTRYNLFAIDLKTRCLSEPDTFDFDVRESIGFQPIGLMEACYATTVDLQEKAEAAYYGSPEEKVISYYKVNESGSLSTISDPAHVGASGKYVTKATEAISHCERFDTTEVIVYDSLAVSTEGSTPLCQGDEVTGLTANNADTYTWIRENGDNAGGASFPYAKDVAQTETFRLIGEQTIGTLYCQASSEGTIKVNENPFTLSDTAFRFCQDTAGADQPLTINKNARTGETLGLVWTNESGDTLFNVNEEARTSILERGETRYNVSQVNMQTQCSSEKAKIDVTVLPQIRIQLKDTTVCEPNTVNLVQFTGKAAKAEEYTNNISAVAYELLQNGSAVDKTSQADSISEGGQYRVTYQYEEDGLTCQSEGTLQLFFNKQPIRPNIADQNFCQNTGSYELAGNVNSAGVRLVWEDLSIFPSRIDTNRTSITTDVATQKLFLIRQVQDVSGCVSEADSAMITIYPAIHAIEKDTAICYGEAVDLNQFSQSSYQGGTPKYNVSFKSIDGQAFSAENVNKSNTYFAYFSDSMNVCQDTAALIVDVNQPIVLNITGGGDACTDQAVTLAVEGAEQYEWSNGEKTPSIILTSNEADTKTLQVEGRSKFHDIYCFADTSVSVTFHNAVQPRALTFDTCARNLVTIDDIVRKNNVTEQVDTIWNLTEDIRYSNLSQNIGKSGQYEVAVHNEEGCKAHHTLTINMHQVDNLSVDKQESTYCYGSLANFTAKGENAREYEWTNLTDGTSKTGTTYNEAIYEKSDFMLIATEKELGCKDTIQFTVDAYPYKDLTITGNLTSCRDSLVILSAEDMLTDIQWQMGDTILTDRNIRFIADVDRRIQVSGIDENGCPATKTVAISVAYLEDPEIAYSTIDDTPYSLSDDVKEVEFKETTTPDGSDLYKFTWSFGDGRTWTDSTTNNVAHTYNDTLIHSRRDINVELIVEHQYGCKKSTSAILKIDPFIFVPNTMIADGSYIFMENYDVQIYDRVGTLIYDGKGWDGTYKGEPASEDTYFYSLTYFDKGEKKIRTGFITVVR